MPDPIDEPVFKKIETPHRRIVTPIPAPESQALLERLAGCEPRSMGGQPPVFWDRAEGIYVHDPWGNKWLDWSSGVLVTNAGHAHPRVVAAVREQLDKPLLHHYCFPSVGRLELAEALADAAPAGLDKVFLLTTGSEATECAIKLARTHGRSVGGDRKIGVVSFVHGFHGRTMGAQMAGGVPALKEWIVNVDPAMVNVPFPDGFRQADTSFDVFLQSLDEQGVRPQDLCAVMLETYQGGSAAFAPAAYIRQLRRWCDEHDVVLIFDEVQAAFGRTGTFWGFEHYGVTPDLICCGKGISSSLPLSAVIGRSALLDQFPPGSMTSTHSGSPLCVAAALANLRIIQEEKLVEHAREMGDILEPELKRLGERFAGPIGAADARGLVGTLQVVRPGTTDPDAELARAVVWRCVRQGLLMFAPVGVGGGTIKVSPPLTTPEDALREGIGVLEDALAACLAERKAVSS